jgi:hypothetical protein
LRAWFGSLAPGGLLLVEDPESIDTTDEVFRTYLRIAGGLIADRGGDLYVGRELGAMAAALGGRVRHDDVETVTPTTGEVATIFGLNLSVWRNDPWVIANNESSALDLLADALAARRATDRVAASRRCDNGRRRLTPGCGRAQAQVPRRRRARMNSTCSAGAPKREPSPARPPAPLHSTVLDGYLLLPRPRCVPRCWRKPGSRLSSATTSRSPILGRDTSACGSPLRDLPLDLSMVDGVSVADADHPRPRAAGSSTPWA